MLLYDYDFVFGSSSASAMICKFRWNFNSEIVFSGDWNFVFFSFFGSSSLLMSSSSPSSSVDYNANWGKDMCVCVVLIGSSVARHLIEGLMIVRLCTALFGCDQSVEWTMVFWYELECIQRDTMGCDWCLIMFDGQLNGCVESESRDRLRKGWWY